MGGDPAAVSITNPLPLPVDIVSQSGADPLNVNLATQDAPIEVELISPDPINTHFTGQDVPVEICPATTNVSLHNETVDVDDAGIVIAPATPGRKALSVWNNGTKTMFVAKGVNVAVGDVAVPNGGAKVLPGGIWIGNGWDGAVSAITLTGEVTVAAVQAW